jgi:ParB/RepB/Spo0J family partition protein
VKTIEQLVEQIPLKSITVVSNARTDMDAKKLAELKHTIIEGGIRTPLLLAPMKVAGVPVDGEYRVVCGHRRFAAATDLGLDTVPAIVRDLTDDEIEVEQLVENDAREDLTALDRAAQYKKLQERGFDAAAIAKRVGRARSTVELTLRLADLVDAGKKALRDGWLPQGAAEELALLSPGVQKDGLKLLEELEKDGNLTRDRAREVLRRELLLDLAEVKFDPRDPHLVPAAGACIPDCAKRTGAQPDLFGGGKGPDCCTDRPCLRAKEGAWLRLQEKAGVRVLSSAEAKQVFPYDHANSVDRDSGYAIADEKDYHHPQSKTYRAQLGKEAKTKVVLARGPDGALVELVARKDLPKPEKATAPKSSKSAEDNRREERHKVKRLVAQHAVRAFNDANGSHLKPGQIHRIAVAGLLKEMQHEARKQLCKLLELKADGDYAECLRALEKHAKALDPDGLGAFVCQLAAASSLVVSQWQEGRDEHLVELCKLGDVDLPSIQKDVELGLREEKRADAKAGAKTAKRKAAARDGKLDLSDGPIIRWAGHRDGRHLRIGKGRSGLTYTVTKGSAVMGNTFTLQSQSPAQLKAGGASVHGIWPDGSSAKITSVQHAVELADALEERTIKELTKAATK